VAIATHNDGDVADRSIGIPAAVRDLGATGAARRIQVAHGLLDGAVCRGSTVRDLAEQVPACIAVGATSGDADA